MEYTESILQYYKTTHKEIPGELLQGQGLVRHFNIFKRNNCMATQPFVRRDYYKICLISGKAVLYTESGEVVIDQPYISFSNPDNKFGWKPISEYPGGYACLFNEEYLSASLKMALKKMYGLFESAVYPLILLNEQEYEMFQDYFEKIHNAYGSDFEYKDEVVHNLLQLIIYEGIKVLESHCPELRKENPKNDVVRRFFELLDRQFPVDSPKNSIQMKSPADFANELRVHVNHLNHCLKLHAGQSTSRLIAERILQEAVELLKNTDWSITEIGDSLGFEYTQHFNAFIKRHTGQSPKYLRS
ncbi:MAG: helix-turn-helix transcriptional regulator [Bacteroidetes bacterium]|nr:helix-turn-helix transcriptional regulator [Bacteroidota bacterium]